MSTMNSKRLGLGAGFGILMGIFCIIGLSQRTPANIQPNITIYLLGGLYNRFIMGIIIGMVGEIVLFNIKNSLLNAVIRGALIGAIVSVGFAFFQQRIDLPFFFASFAFGAIADVLTTIIQEKLNKRE